MSVPHPRGTVMKTRAAASLASSARGRHHQIVPVIQLARGPEGLLTYAIAVPPEALPPVRPRDLLRAWDMAREAAASEAFGSPRLLRFARPGAEATTLALADRDAAAWAEAIDTLADLTTLGGLSLCLRLLALVELLARAPFLAPLWKVTPEGAEFHPDLIDAASKAPLDSAARFDAEALRALVFRAMIAEA